MRELVSQGWRVTVAAPEINEDVRRTWLEIGVEPLEVTTARTGMNPLADLRYFGALTAMFRERKPDVVIAYAAKPAIWGTLAARMAKVPRIMPMITGLGYAFTPTLRPSPKQKFANLAASLLYRIALPWANHVLFLNPDDRALFLRLGLIRTPGKDSVLPGEGIDLELFPPSPPPSRPSFLMLARLLRAKGTYEYAAAAASLKARYPDVEFRLAGDFDSGPDSIDPTDLERWIEGGLAYLGPLAEVRPALAEAAVYVLPSYREGMPRSVLEAMATGRAVVTTDVPGCRETVVSGVNGFIVPARAAEPLAEAMERFIGDPSLIAAMGQKSLEMARSTYDVKKINHRIIALLGVGDGDGRSESL